MDFSQRQYDIARMESLKWEKILAGTKDVISDKEALTFCLLDQIQQLYRMFCKRNNIEPIFQRHQIEEQLDFIKEEIDTIHEIIQLSDQLMAKEQRSDVANAGSEKAQK